MPSCCPWSALRGLPGPLSGTRAAGRAGDGTGAGSVAASLVRVRALRAWGPLPPLELELRVGLVPYDASFSRELLSRYREQRHVCPTTPKPFMTV